jgi:PTH2 family peptidyl-tRNA hydrolase
MALSLDESGYKMVIAVRVDLEMGRGKIAVQVAHAAVAALEEARRGRRDWAEAWLDGGQRKIAVKVRSERELVMLGKLAKGLKIPSVMIRDKGLTQLPPDTATCIGIGPAPFDLIDKITRDLKLL